MTKCDLVDDVKIDLWHVVCVVYGRRLPNWILEGIIFGPFHAFGESIVYIPTKFRENILIGSRDMPQKRNLKRVLWRQNSTSGFKFGKCLPARTLLCIIVQNFKKIAQCTVELNLHCQRHIDAVPSCRPAIASQLFTDGYQHVNY